MTSLVVLSGISGSGKSTAMKLFEDLGYFCVDNLPPDLLSTFIELCENSREGIERVAFAMDVREGVFFQSAPIALRTLKDSNIDMDVLFLDCADEKLIQRFKETRRKHPLDTEGDIRRGITKERDQLEPLRLLADHVIDTTSFTPAELREVLRERFAPGPGQRLSLNFLSFGYKNGIPADADMVFDVRFLPNPHYVEHLEPLSGLDHQVKDYVVGNDYAEKFIKKALDLLRFLIPLYEKEGKSYLTVAMGCTGGKHRSVAIAEEIARRLAPLSPRVRHRDIPTEGGR